MRTLPKAVLITKISAITPLLLMGLVPSSTPNVGEAAVLPVEIGRRAASLRLPCTRASTNGVVPVAALVASLEILTVADLS